MFPRKTSERKIVGKTMEARFEYHGRVNQKIKKTQLGCTLDLIGQTAWWTNDYQTSC